VNIHWGINKIGVSITSRQRTVAWHQSINNCQVLSLWSNRSQLNSGLCKNCYMGQLTVKSCHFEVTDHSLIQAYAKIIWFGSIPYLHCMHWCSVSLTTFYGGQRVCLTLLIFCRRMVCIYNECGNYIALKKWTSVAGTQFQQGYIWRPSWMSGRADHQKEPSCT
jgi:hypothetical protein